LVSGHGEGEQLRVISFDAERSEELRQDLLAFRVYRTRSLEKSADLLWFVNKWGMPEWGSFFGGERVNRVRDLLRQLAEASIGPSHAQRGIDQLAPRRSISISSTIRYVDNEWITETQAFELRDVLLTLLSRWADKPATRCANSQCDQLAFGQKYCGRVCANRVQTRRAKRMQRVRNALTRGETDQAIADKYMVSVADVLAQRQGLKAKTRSRHTKGRKAKGAR
jgi:hypothetical protein